MLALSANAKIAYWPRELRFPGAIAQLEEHLLCKQGVRGSSPLSSTASSRAKAPLAWRGSSAHNHVSYLAYL